MNFLNWLTLNWFNDRTKSSKLGLKRLKNNNIFFKLADLIHNYDNVFVSTVFVSLKCMNLKTKNFLNYFFHFRPPHQLAKSAWTTENGFWPKSRDVCDFNNFQHCLSEAVA